MHVERGLDSSFLASLYLRGCFTYFFYTMSFLSSCFTLDIERHDLFELVQLLYAGFRAGSLRGGRDRDRDMI